MANVPAQTTTLADCYFKQLILAGIMLVIAAFFLAMTILAGLQSAIFITSGCIIFGGGLFFIAHSLFNPKFPRDRGWVIVGWFVAGVAIVPFNPLINDALILAIGAGWLGMGMIFLGMHHYLRR